MSKQSMEEQSRQAKEQLHGAKRDIKEGVSMEPDVKESCSVRQSIKDTLAKGVDAVKSVKHKVCKSISGGDHPKKA